MNLALHGFLLQVFVLILDFQYGFRLCSAGEPGYLDFDNLPETNFSCQGKVIGGYYADVEAGCQMFHVCTIGQKDEIMDIKFLCLNGTVFDQETRVCERVDEVDCSKSERFYNLNLELYGNNAVTLSLHENSEGEDDRSEAIEDHQQRSTSARPASTSTTSTTTSRPSQPSTTASSGSFQHPTGYPQHYQPQPSFPQVHTSQSKSLYDDKNGGYHHQYIFHNGERNDNQATSFQLFSNQGISSTTAQPPQVHQVRFSSTAVPQIIHNEPSTVSPLFHSSSTIQTLLSNANGPALINPIFHNHGIASTTEQYTVHSSNPRETSEYQDDEEQEQNIRTLEAVQSTKQGKVPKLTVSAVPSQSSQTKSNRNSQQQRISMGFLPTPATIETTIRSFYPTPRTSSKTSSTSSTSNQVTHHIHVPPPPSIPQLKPQQITINLPPPDLQRLIQNPPPLLPSQSRVIVTAKASVSDESGRPLNSTQILTLPLSRLPSSYDDYKEGDESLDPFYRDVPKIQNNRRIVKSTSESTRSERRRRFVEQGTDFMRNFVYRGKPRSLYPVSVNGVRENGRIKRSLSEARDSRTHIVFGADDDSGPFRLRGIAGDTSEEESEDVGNVEDKVLGLRDMVFDGKSSRNYTREVTESVQDLVIKASRYRRVFDDEDSEGDESEEEEEESKNHYGEVKEDTDDDKNSAPLDAKSSRVEDTENEEGSGSKSAPNTEIPGAEEHIEKDSESGKNSNSAKAEDNSSIANAKKSDTKMYILPDISTEKSDFEVNKEFISSLSTKESDAEEYIVMDEPASKLNSSDGKSYVSALNTKESDAEEYIETEETESTLNSEKNAKYISTADTKESDSGEYVPKEELNKNSDFKKGNKHILDDETLPTSDKKILHSEDFERSENSEVSIDSSAEIKGETPGNEDVENKKASNLKNTARKSGNERNSEKSESTESGSWSREEPRSDSRKKGRPRSSRRRSSARRKSHKQHSTEDESIDPKTGRKISTTTLSILHLESETERRIDGQILEEPESQSRKELGTRAVAHSDAKHLKTHRKNSGIEIEKSVFRNRYNTLDTAKGSQTNAKGTEERSEEVRGKDEERRGHLAVDSKEKDKMQNIGESSESSDSLEVDERSTEISDQSPEIEQSSEYVRTIEETGSLEYISEERSVSVREKTKKYETSEESEDVPTTQSSEQIFSDELSSEYPDSHETSLEDSRETSAEEDYKESFSPEDITTSTEFTSSEEITDSREIINESNESTASDENDSTEGILKFTDELPNTEEEEDTQETDEEHLDSSDASQDYVDDNYEPENYKEHASSIEPENLSEEKVKKDALDDKKLNATDRDSVELVTLQKDEDQIKEISKDDKNKSSTVGLDEEDISEIMTTTTSTTTTSTTSTTAPLPTPPKLFRPISMRKSYSYIPPTTTPNPVIIKPRISLLNPKPAKPPKSYNELAPKPVIRKLPLLARKTTTTASTTTTDEEVASESTALDVITTTELVKNEVNISDNKSRIDQTHEDLANNSSNKVTAAVKDANDEIMHSSREKASTTESNEEMTANVNIENFTPYPLLRLPSITETDEKALEDSGHEESRIQDTTIESMVLTTEMTNAEETISTTLRALGLMDRDESNDNSDSTTADTYSKDTSSNFESTTLSSSDLTDVTLSVLSKINPSVSKSSTLVDVVSTTPASLTTIPIPSTESGHEATSASSSETLPTVTKSEDLSEESKATTITASEEATVLKTVETSTSADNLSASSPASESSTARKSEASNVLESTKSVPVRPLNLKGFKQRRHGGFNCLEKEMYRFYGDARDCRLFHYCSPGFTSRQVLDFRFVCEEGTVFDEETQSCRHDVRDRKCAYPRW